MNDLTLRELILSTNFYATVGGSLLIIIFLLMYIAFGKDIMQKALEEKRLRAKIK